MGVKIAVHIQRLEDHFKMVIEGRGWPDPLNNYPYITINEGGEKMDNFKKRLNFP